MVFFYKILLLLSVFMSSTAIASNEMLNRPVTLQSEASLIDALSTTLQHAILISGSYQGTNPKLKRLADSEFRKRQQTLLLLHKLRNTKAPNIKKLGIVRSNDATYQQAMLQNHARLMELIEFGSALQLSGATRRYIRSLSSEIPPEISMLSAASA